MIRVTRPGRRGAEVTFCERGLIVAFHSARKSPSSRRLEDPDTKRRLVVSTRATLRSFCYAEAEAQAFCTTMFDYYAYAPNMA